MNLVMTSAQALCACGYDPQAFKTNENMDASGEVCCWSGVCTCVYVYVCIIVYIMCMYV